MIRRKISKDGQQYQSLNEDSFTNKKGIDVTQAPPMRDFVFDAENLDVNLDGSMSLRKPLKYFHSHRYSYAKELYNKIHYIAIKNDTSSSSYIQQHVLVINPSAVSGTSCRIRYKNVLYTDATGMNFKNAKTFNTNSSTILYDVELNLNTFLNGAANPNITGLTTVKAYFRITLEEINGVTLAILEYIDPYIPNLTRTETTAEFNPNTAGYYTYAVTDSYDAAVNSVQGILAYSYVSNNVPVYIKDLTEFNNYGNNIISSFSKADTSKPVILKAFCNFNSYGNIRYYCAWEYTSDGINWECPEEFINKFPKDYTTNKPRQCYLKVLDETRMEESLDPSTPIYKNVIAVPLSYVNSSSDIITDRPDVLILPNGIKGYTYRFSIYAIETSNLKLEYRTVDLDYTYSSVHSGEGDHNPDVTQYQTSNHLTPYHCYYTSSVTTDLSFTVLIQYYFNNELNLDENKFKAVLNITEDEGTNTTVSDLNSSYFNVYKEWDTHLNKSINRVAFLYHPTLVGAADSWFTSITKTDNIRLELSIFYDGLYLDCYKWGIIRCKETVSKYYWGTIATVDELPNVDHVSADDKFVRVLSNNKYYYTNEIADAPGTYEWLEWTGTETTFYDTVANNLLNNFTGLTLYNADATLLSNFPYSALITDTTELLNTNLVNTVDGEKLYYNYKIYSYGKEDFKNCIYISDSNSFVTSLLNTIELPMAQDSKITTLIPWRDYLIAASETGLFLITPQGGNYYTSKIINTFIGIPWNDRKTAKSILNGIIFKSGSKIYSVQPSMYASDDSILNIIDISKPIAPYLENTNTSTNFAFTTEQHYYLCIPKSNTTTVLKYEYSTKIWTKHSYPVVFTDVWINTVDEIRLIAPSAFYDFNHEMNEIDANYLQYGDELTLGEITPFTYYVDTGQKSYSMNLIKQFVESKLTFALTDKSDELPLTVDVYVDQYRPVLHQDVSSSSSFWKKLDSTIALGAPIPATTTTSAGILVNNPVMKQLFLRYSAKGYTIRHIVSGMSHSQFKFYVSYYRYKSTSNKQ